MAACDAATNGQRAAKRNTTSTTSTAPSTSTTSPSNPLLQKVVGYVDPYHAKVQSAGYRAKTAKVNAVEFSYWEGPDNGPPLVLLHAQQLDWFSYSRVLPQLAKNFHVYDIDYQGHGQTSTPDNYVMSANQLGTDLAGLIRQVIRRPVFVTGNSSGGLLATWLAANTPDLVTAALLEDPPLFSSEYPRIKQTIAYPDFHTSDEGVREHVADFLLFWITQSTTFINNNVGPGSATLLTLAVKAYRRAHPGAPVELGVVPNDTIRMFFRGMDHQYDPRFGSAFYRGTWNQGFDHATALSKITCPTMLLQANYTYNAGHILNGAMSQQDAQKAQSLLRNGRFQRVDSSHVINLDKPTEFLHILQNFFQP